MIRQFLDPREEYVHVRGRATRRDMVEEVRGGCDVISILYIQNIYMWGGGGEGERGWLDGAGMAGFRGRAGQWFLQASAWTPIQPAVKMPNNEVGV